MKKTFLIEVLKKLSAKQMKELTDFVQSPFFNKNESVVSLMEYLRNQHPEFKSSNIEKELVHKKLFHSAEYNDNFMRLLIFKLTSVVEQYLAYTDFKSHENTESIHLINRLIDMNIDNEAKRQITRVEKRLNADKISNSSHYKDHYELEKLKHVIYSRTYRPVTIKDKPDETLLGESNHLTAFFLISILQRYRYLLNKSFTVNSKYNADLLPVIISYLEGEGKAYLEIPAVSLLYKQMLLLNDYSREDLIAELTQKLTNKNTLIDDQDRRDGLTVVSNVCIEKGYEGKDEFYRHMLNIDKYLISENLHTRIKGGYFEKEVFSNIVTIALRVNDTDYVKDFIEKYYKMLEPDVQISTYNYSYSKLYFKLRDFNKALEYIVKVSYSDMHSKYTVRVTEIMIHYELNNIETALTLLENFKKYIQNDKLLSTGHKKIMSNFIKYSTALCKAKYSHRANLEELKENIASADQISNRLWLINKADDIMKLRKSSK